MHSPNVPQTSEALATHARRATQLSRQKKMTTVFGAVGTDHIEQQRQGHTPGATGVPWGM